jgi:drug/metabolite transporter (DMT)-like permease
VASAHGSCWAAAVLLAPATLLAPGPLRADPSLPIDAMGPLALIVLVLGVFCTGVAFLLYFRLVSDVGPTSALTVTFLVPMFGVLWGRLFLDEALHWHTALGGVIIIAGTALTMGLSPSGMLSLLRRARGRAQPSSRPSTS